MKKFKLDYSFILLFILIAFSPKQGILLKLFLALVLHELGHLFCIFLCRYRIKCLRLSIVGFFLTLEDTKEVFLKDILIYLGGILSNLIWYLLVPDPTFKALNLMLILINSLPIFPLDGFNVIRSIAYYLFPYYYANRGMSILSILSAAVLMVLAFYFHFDLVIILNLVYLLVLNIESFRKERLSYHHFLLKKQLYPQENPKKEIRFHENYEYYFYKYHTINMRIGNRLISEKELFNTKRIGN